VSFQAEPEFPAARPTDADRPRANVSAARRRRLDQWFGAGLTVPALLVITSVFAFPVCYAVWLSLHSNSVEGLPTQFVGFGNYVALFHDGVFIGSVGRTLYFTVVTVIPGIALALGLAMLLNRQFRGRAVACVLMLVPWATPEVSTGITWHLIYNPAYGILNVVLLKLGIVNHNISWTGTQNLALNCVAFAQLWALIPFMALVLLAALQRVPLSLYRAARVDGAGSLSRFRHVILPTIRYPLVFAFLVQTMWSLRVFGVIYVITSGGPANGTTTLNYYAFEQSFEYLNFGTGSSIAIVVAVATLFTTLGYLVLMIQPRSKAK